LQKQKNIGWVMLWSVHLLDGIVKLNLKVRNLKVAELEAYLQESLAYVGDVLDELGLGDLEISRISPRNDQEVTVAWALIHALKHTAIHLGHVQITRQLWEEQQVN
jgi:hypothetical protein